MKQKNSGGLLLIIILLLSASMGIIYGRKLPNSSQRQSTLTIQDTIDLITPLIISKSFDAIAQTLQRFDTQTALQTIENILANPVQSFTKKDRAILLLNLIAYFNDKQFDNKMIALLQSAHATDPVYTYAVLDNTPQAIDRLLPMIQKRDSAQATTWAEQSMRHAVRKDDVSLIESLYSRGVRVSPQLASELLYEVAAKNYEVDFVPFLVRTMNADVNFSPDNKKTILIQAIENKNEQIVKALLELGADPDKMVNEEVGTPSQIAFEQGLVSIEQLLKKAQRKK